MYNIWPKVFRSQCFFDNTISLILDTAYGHVQVYMTVIGLDMDLTLLLIMGDLYSLFKIVFLCSRSDDIVWLASHKFGP